MTQKICILNSDTGLIDAIDISLLPSGGGSGGGGAGNRQTASITTASLVALGTEIGIITLAKTLILISVYASVACRVRLYATSLQRELDAARSSSVPPTAGTQNGVICDLRLDVVSVPGGFPATWYLSPPATGANCDSTPSSTIYYAIDNLSEGNSAIDVTFTFIQVEADSIPTS